MAALLLHAAVIALAMISFIPNPMQQQASQQGVSVVFENGGTQSTTAPPSPLKSTSTQAETPPPPLPPPPAPDAFEPQTNLNLPSNPFADIPQPQQAPQQEPQQQAQPQPRRQVVQRHRQPRYSQYQVMNNMSLNNGSAPQAAPSFTGKPGLNLQLSQSDLNSMIAPQIQVQGDIGQDWMDGFNKWVNDHIYYPQAAAENGDQGTSVIQFTVHRDGSVTGLHLVTSAGSVFLDQAWLGIFKNNKVPAFPPGTKSDTIVITGSLQYEIVPPGGGQ